MRHQSKPFIELAQSIGFESVGIVQAQRLEKEALQLEEWLANGFHGEMTYMERYFDLRIDPTKLLEGCKSVIMLTLNYDQPQIHLSEDLSMLMVKIIIGLLRTSVTYCYIQ